MFLKKLLAGWAGECGGMYEAIVICSGFSYCTPKGRACVRECEWEGEGEGARVDDRVSEQAKEHGEIM